MNSGEAGFATSHVILGVGAGLVLFVALANLVVIQYGQGVVEGAATDAARAGTALGADPGTCIRRATDMVDDLMGGALVTGDGIECRLVAGVLRVTVRATVKGWLPLVPDVSVEGRAVRVAEP